MSRRVVQWLCVLVAACSWVNVTATASEHDLIGVARYGFGFAYLLFAYVGWIRPWIERQA